MSIDLRYSLDELVSTYRRAIDTPSPEHESPEHAGLTAVLNQITDAARHAIARNLDRYDHRSLYEFAAAMDYATKSDES